MKKLTLYPVQKIDELVQPADFKEKTLLSPAMDFFTDFRDVEPLVIEGPVPAPEARSLMIRTHVRLKIVVDAAGHFAGVVSAADLSEQNIIAEAAGSGVPRDEVPVSDLMTRKQDLLALNIHEVSSSTIGDVIDFLQDNYQQHCLVIDEDTHQIRGVFSASDISRKLRLPVNIQEQSSFSKVFFAVS
ncbi:CBS domain-containing protein [Thalassolituus sp.]|jgi:CBS domain-containing protein|uniref:CBS domain-containing protein n=1 Tax=Thalassolituus sp. TaxID=2030822 RepID=UPI00261AE134|nr:CBS domain-containing protein [Thalassolituus sp.]